MLFRSDRKSTRLNSSHTIISYAVFCLKKKKNIVLRGCCSAGLPPLASAEGSGAVPGHMARVRGPVWTSLSRVRDVRHLFFFFKEPGPPGLCPLPLHGALPT